MTKVYLLIYWFDSLCHWYAHNAQIKDDDEEPWMTAHVVLLISRDSRQNADKLRKPLTLKIDSTIKNI